MRKVFNGDMVFHVWANQSQQSGRRSDNRVFFEGRAIYSYGRHYMLGYVMPDGVTLLNSSRYSTSTGKHKSQTWRAARGTTLEFPDLTELADSNRLLRSNLWFHIERYLAQHWREISPDSAQYLITLAKRKTPWESIRAKHEKKAAKIAAEQVKEQEKYLVLKATRYMNEVPQAEFEAEIERISMRENTIYVKDDGERYKRWRQTRPHENLSDIYKDFRAMLAACRKYGGKRVTAHIEARTKYINAKKRRFARNAALSDRLMSFRRRKLAFRQLLELIQDGATERRYYQEAIGHIRIFETFHGVDATKAATLAIKLQTRHDELKASEERERFEREQAARADWLAGNGNRYWRGSDENGRALLRIVGDVLQTSHGAEVPLSHAIKAFHVIRYCRERGAEWQRNGKQIRVGHFQIDSIDSQGNFKAGCHNIGWNEVSRIAESLGLFAETIGETEMRAALTDSH